MKRVVLALVFLLIAAPPVVAQTLQTNGMPARLDAPFVPAAPQGGTGHHGFTVFANIGAGLQHDGFYQQTAGGLAGANLGIGAFISDRVAVLFRISGTRATFDDPNVRCLRWHDPVLAE